MQLLKRKKADPSFVISIESGVEEVREVKVRTNCGQPVRDWIFKLANSKHIPVHLINELLVLICLTQVHQECDYLVDVLTGKRSVSPDFCCKMLYMIFCTCFTTESNQRKTGTTIMARSVATNSATTITQRPLTYQTI
uniref:Uncharacterized protein n=1 Tax=Anopheles maculatus TaxID=74869 RepID=A0A182SWD9_9DIPT